MGDEWRAAAVWKLVLGTLCLSHLLKSVAGANYIVGQRFVTGGLWTNDPGPNINNLTLFQQYESWAKSVNISVGDTLIFNYDDAHTVVLVPRPEMFDSCDYTTYQDVTSPTPPTTYTIKDVEPLYFICSIDKHCVDGQKVAITNILPAGSPVPSMVAPPSPSVSNQGESLQSGCRYRWCSTLDAGARLLRRDCGYTGSEIAAGHILVIDGG
ncbi:hypothetical protein R1flu_023722 [Riccia fluitans]|uniref:Phytocyanin domain-containing protein n=1 Tax=Riccia fluitans TaxID=41844 RepID=A0ABD1XSV5_9MARC